MNVSPAGETFGPYAPVSQRYNDRRGWRQYVFHFDNGFGASVVRGRFTYGGDRGLWELAVLRVLSANDWELDYGTPITSDVVGYLTSAQVVDLLRAIAALPAAQAP